MLTKPLLPMAQSLKLINPIHSDGIGIKKKKLIHLYNTITQLHKGEHQYAA